MKGISFSTPLVPKVLDGTKDVTRRLIKPQPPFVDPLEFRGGRWGLGNWSAKPPYRPGEIVYLKEAWALVNIYGAEITPEEYKGRPGRTILYKAGGPPWVYDTGREEPDFSNGPMGKMVPKWSETLTEPRWRSPRFMPEWASRCKLEIVSCTPDQWRLITLSEAIREGFTSVEEFLAYFATLHKGPIPDWDWRIEFKKVQP